MIATKTINLRTLYTDLQTMDWTYLCNGRWATDE